MLTLFGVVVVVLSACSPGFRQTPGPSVTHLPAVVPDGDRWQPAVGSSFYIQYNDKIDFGRDVDVYNLDGEGTTADEVRGLRERGVAPVCYINAGAFEDWRSDADRFPKDVLGKPMDGWPGEFWLDVRRLDVLVPIMAARMDMCAGKGFVGVDPDNTNGWQQDTGFPISPENQIAYQRALADEAHRRGLAIGLKNNADQLDQIGPMVDFAVNEQCVEYHECDAYIPFLASGRPVFTIEYKGKIEDICRSVPPGMTVVRKDLSLSAGGSSC